MKTNIMKMSVVLIAGLAAVAAPTFAHHSGAAFDMTEPVVLENAIVTEFLWVNPHPLIKADFTDEYAAILDDGK